MDAKQTTWDDHVIVLKTWPEQWDAVDDGSKPFEVRKNDRPFHVGAILILQKWNPTIEDYIYCEGHPVMCARRVTHILQGGQFGIEAGYVVMGLERLVA